MDAKIKAALSQLDPNKDADWTQAGLPHMERVKELVGKSDLTRQEVTDAVPGFNRTNAKAAPSDLSNAGGGGDAGPTTKAQEQVNAPNEGEPGAPVGNHSDVKEQFRTPAEISQDEADDQLPPGQAAINQTSSLYPEITAGGGGQPGEPDGPLIAEAAVPEADDAIAAIEHAIGLGNADRYRRNSPLQNFIRHWQVEQDAIKAYQGRLDIRDRDRKAQNAEADKAEQARRAG